LYGLVSFPEKIALVEDDKAPGESKVVVRSPKSVALPVAAMVINSMTFETLGVQMI